MEEVKKENLKRPLGITILCILEWLEAIVILVAGLVLIGVGFFGASLIGNLIGGNIFGIPTEDSGIVGLFAEIVGILGIFLATVGALSILITRWLWKMQKRGWKWAMYAQVSTLILGTVGLFLDPTAIFELIIPAIIVVYLWMKKDLFQ